MPLFFHLIHFREVGQIYKNIFVRFLVQMKTVNFAFEINWPLRPWHDTVDWNSFFAISKEKGSSYSNILIKILGNLYRIYHKKMWQFFKKKTIILLPYYDAIVWWNKSLKFNFLFPLERTQTCIQFINPKNLRKVHTSNYHISIHFFTVV